MSASPKSPALLETSSLSLLIHFRGKTVKPNLKSVYCGRAVSCRYPSQARKVKYWIQPQLKRQELPVHPNFLLTKLALPAVISNGLLSIPIFSPGV